MYKRRGSSSKPSVFVALLVSSASICVQRQTPSGFVTSAAIEGKRRRKDCRKILRSRGSNLMCIALLRCKRLHRWISCQNGLKGDKKFPHIRGIYTQWVVTSGAIEGKRQRNNYMEISTNVSKHTKDVKCWMLDASRSRPPVSKFSVFITNSVRPLKEHR